MTEKKTTTKRATKPVAKRTTSAKPKTPRARAPKKTASDNPERVALLQTHVGSNLLIRSNPSEADVVGFVTEHNRRYYAGEPGGPSGQPAFLIQSAAFFDNEVEAEEGTNGTPINI